MNSAWGMFWGYWIVVGWCLRTFMVFGCVWGIILVFIPCRVVNLHRCDIALKGNIFFTWPYWDIKISKCLYIRLKKMVEFCNLLIFWCPSERHYKIQLYYITLYLSKKCQIISKNRRGAGGQSLFGKIKRKSSNVGLGFIYMCICIRQLIVFQKIFCSQ